MKLTPIILQGDWYDLAFSHFVQKDKKHFDEFYDLLSKPRFRVKETSESYRSINYWDENGLLLGKRDVADSWRQFSIIDVIWLRILQALKQYGMQNEKLLTLKEYLFRIQDKQGRYVQFAFWINTALNRVDVSLIVLPDGKGDIATPQDVEAQKLFDTLGNSHIMIDFKDLVLSVVNPEDKTGRGTTTIMKKLEPTEVELLETISQKGVDSVTVHMRYNKIDRIEWKKVVENPELLFEILREKVDESPNQTITIKRHNGKVIFIEQKQSHKPT
jgi:hypothetical protein